MTEDSNTGLENKIVLVDEEQTNYQARSYNYDIKLEKKLWPFLVEKLKSRDSVILKEEDVRTFFDAPKKRINFNSFYIKLLLLFKDKEIMCSKAKHTNGTNLFIFKYREFIDKEDL